MKKKIYVEGMTCEHCVKHVREALEEVHGVQRAEVDLEGKYAVVVLDNDVSDEVLKGAIEEVEYEVAGIESV